MRANRENPLTHHVSALVTGAGSGIGRAFSLALAKRGCTVVCVDLDLNAAKETVAAIQQQYLETAYAFACDVSQFQQMQNLALKVEQQLAQPIQLLINNAGVGLGGRFDEISRQDWQWCLDVNLWGVIHGCQTFLPQLKKAQQKHQPSAIINVASAAAYTAAPEMTAYNVSKSGVLALSESLAAELAEEGIRIHVLCPTLVPTNIMKNGKLPDSYASKANHLLTHHASVTAEQVAEMTLDRLDRGKFYTMPQWDAKLFWWLKRHFPLAYQKTLAMGYPWFKRWIKR